MCVYLRQKCIHNHKQFSLYKSRVCTPPTIVRTNYVVLLVHRGQKCRHWIFKTFFTCCRHQDVNEVWEHAVAYINYSTKKCYTRGMVKCRSFET